MVKNKIALKLTSYFTTALLVFTLFISIIFTILFRNYTINTNKEMLLTRADSIADNLGVYLSENRGPGMMGYGSYIKNLSDIALADVWVIDRNLNILGLGTGNHSFTYKDLPLNADTIIQQVLAGETKFSENFSDLLNNPTLTIGKPIVLNDGSIGGVLLMHTPIQGIDHGIMDGLQILLISLVVALMISIILSYRLSIGFTSSLNKMNATTQSISMGHYKVKNNLNRDDEIGELAQSIDLLADQLETAQNERNKLDQMRNDLFANVSHELRTPITVIRGYLEALRDGVVTEEQMVKKYYKQMITETNNLQTLVSDLLDLSKIQNSDFEINDEPLLINEIISDTVNSAHSLAYNKNITIRKEEYDQPIIMNGDYNRIRQMFMIILDNAIKFSNESGIIDLKINNKKEPIVSITNYGPKINEDDLPYIFDKFYKTSTSNSNGSGLGLSIAKQIALRHQIEIKVDSNENFTTFTFIFNTV